MTTAPVRLRHLLPAALAGVACTPAPTAAGPAPRSAASAAQATDTLRVPLGGAVRHAPSGLTVEFVEVGRDSRCPANVTCVWAGDVEAAVRLTDGAGRHAAARLHLNPRPGVGERSVALGEQVVTFVHLLPYPGAGTPSPDAPTTAWVTVAPR